MALNSEPPARLSLRCAESTASSLLCVIYTFSEPAVSLDPETEAQFVYDKEEKQADRSLEMEIHEVERKPQEYIVIIAGGFPGSTF